MVQYRTNVKTQTLTPSTTPVLNVSVISAGTDVTSIQDSNATIKLLSNNGDGTITIQITEIQEFVT